MSRRFVRNIEPNIKEMVQQDECGCAQRIAPWLTQTGVVPCLEPHITGSNILRDPGFETQISMWGGGPGGNEIPALPDSGTQLVWPSNNSAYGNNDTYWLSYPNYTANEIFTIESTDPDAGTYHAQTVYDDSGGGSVPASWAIFPIAGFKCNPGGSMVAPYHYYSAVVAAGDVWTWSIRVKATSTANSPEAYVEVDLYNAAGTYVDTITGTFAAVTTAYQTFTANGVASVAGYLQARVQVSHFSIGSDTFRFDTAILSVT